MSRNTQGLKRGGSLGRKKGQPNRFTVALKDLILQSLTDAGGAVYLAQQAKKHPAAFLALLGKVLPLQMRQDGAEPMMPTVVIHELHHD